jgi:hypothetical protein
MNSTCERHARARVEAEGEQSYYERKIIEIALAASAPESGDVLSAE